MQSKKPRFKYLPFQTKQQKIDYLIPHIAKTVHLKGSQDLTKFYIDKYGEILQCDAQGNIWNGEFVHVSSLKVNEPVFFFKNGIYGKSNLIVEKVSNKYDE